MSKIQKKMKFIITINLLSSITYLYSLCNIEEPEMKCFSKKGLDCIYILFKLTFISSILISISIYIAIFNERKKYKIFHFLIFLFIYLLFYFLDHNNKIIKHGLFNFLGFLFSTLLLLVIFWIFNCLFYLIKKKQFFILILIFLSIIFFIFQLKKYTLNRFSCDRWAKGFNNSYIDNSSKNYPCNIYIPQHHSCYSSEFGSFFDFTKKYRPTCLDRNLIKYEKEKFLKDMNNLK